MARPTDYTKELGIDICKLVASGKSLKRIGERDDMPCRSTLHSWLLDDDKKEFLDKYKEACDVRVENMFDELEEIADTSDEDESSNRSRLRIDTRKWYLSKIMPKKYGDKIDVTSDGEKVQPVLVTYIDEKEPENNKDTD